MVVLWMTNPIWIAKTRMCLQYESLSCAEAASTSAVPSSLERLTVLRCLADIWRTEGLRGFYRGMIPGMLGVSSGALQFLLYEQLRNQYNGYHQRSIDSHLVRYATTATIASHYFETAYFPFRECLST